MFKIMSQSLAPHCPRLNSVWLPVPFLPSNSAIMVKETPAGYPAWVDKFYFNDILRKDYDQFKVVRFNVEPLSAKGENYASSMYRVKLTVENSKTGLALRNFVVKANIEDTSGRLTPEVREAFNLFPKEIEMYTVILPAFEKLFADVGETVVFSPKCFAGTRDPGDLIIMEDLKMAGFRTVNRFEGVDFEHTKLMIAKLAQFHAASAVFLEKGNTFDKKYDAGIISDDKKPMMAAMHKASAGVMKEVTQNWKCGKILEKYEKEMHDLFTDKIFDLVKRNNSRFNVLCHGDLWSNNLMYKYDEETGKVTECLLVDLQMCHHNTPMVDLQYFIYSSLQQECRLTKVDHILQYYHQQLVANLKKLGFKGKLPTLLQFQKDFLEIGPLGLNTAFGTLTVALAPSSDDSDLASIMKDISAFRRRVMTNPSYVKVIEELVPYFERKGILQG